jgi:hypothetical protein
MKYVHLLLIRTSDWDHASPLCVFTKEPTEEDKKNVIREYWFQFEKGLFQEFNDFLEALILAGKEQTTPYKKGIWIEKVAQVEN